LGWVERILTVIFDNRKELSIEVFDSIESDLEIIDYVIKSAEKRE
jgi:hypothetical protein